MLVAKSEGNYRFFPSMSGNPFCSGVIADQGYEIVRVTLERLIPWRAGFKLIGKHLETLGRPRQALCGVELRCSAPYTLEGFQAFNAEYGEVLQEWGLYGRSVGTGTSARTNIAPTYHAPGEQMMFAFSYTVPSTSNRPTFVISGTAGGVRRGEASTDANREQVASIVRVLEERLAALGVSWDLTTEVAIYTHNDIEAALRAELIPKIGAAVLNGVRWFPGRPPVIGSDNEMDAYGVRQELRITAP
jgi:hypothetical protein